MSKTEKRPTMKDVARLAGVSYQTVSCVINNIPVISEETRQRVLDAIQQLNYTPDASARSLRSGRSRIIGLMLPDAQNPHFWHIVRGAEDEAVAAGYSLLLATTSMERQRERNAFDALMRERLDAIIPLFTYPEDFTSDLRTLLQRRFPVATMMSGVPAGLGLDRVHSHFEHAAHELMEHLLALGHRQIALIRGVGRSEFGQDRVTIYLAALAGAGISFEAERLVTCGHTLEDGFRAAEQLLDLEPRPTAIIGINDLIAFAALQAVQRRGLRVPDDVSVAGFDDITMSAFLSPPLTTGRVDSVEIGRSLVRLVLDRLADPDLEARELDVATHLVVRGSTGPCREVRAKD
jgi:LacI family transcriptional regulator